MGGKMNQTDLIQRVSDVLNSDERIGGAFLGGSYGRDEADEYSDVDVYAVVAEADQIQDVLTHLTHVVSEITPLLFYKVLQNARTINYITVDWLRFDLTVVNGFELLFLTGGKVKPLFDRLGLSIPSADETAAQPLRSPDELLDVINEFIRVLGLSVVAKGREDLVVAQKGTNLLWDMLIRVMVMSNGVSVRRGVLALRRDLTNEQLEILAALPVGSSWSSVFERTEAIAHHFFQIAKALAQEIGGEWPHKFEQATLRHLEQNLDLKIS